MIYWLINVTADVVVAYIVLYMYFVTYSVFVY